MTRRSSGLTPTVEAVPGVTPGRVQDVTKSARSAPQRICLDPMSPVTAPSQRENIFSYFEFPLFDSFIMPSFNLFFK
jgi:hypothetical protein